jgi:hypothetical protein
VVTEPGVVISEPNGGKLKIDFRENGKVKFNGQDWVQRPLESVDAEVTRIQKFINGSSEQGFLWDQLVPSAHAGPGASAGMAVVAHAVSTAWTAEACKEHGISDELMRRCSLMAVSMRDPVDASTRDPAEFLPIIMKCSADNAGTFELIEKNKNGRYRRYRVGYKGPKAAWVTMAVAPSQTDKFTEFVNINLEGQVPNEQKALANAIASKGDEIEANVCNGNEVQKKRYLASLEANKKELLSSLREEDSPGNSSNINAL